MNEDLHRARQLLESGGYTCVLCKNTNIQTSTISGIRPLMELLNTGSWAGYSAADKVVGKATAFLYVLLGIRAVYSPVASEAASRILKEHGIVLNCDLIVPAIFNRDHTGFCPMETAVQEIEDPQEALSVIRETLAKLRQPKPSN